MFSLPVIAARVGGVPEIIRDNEDGILVDAGDPTQLAEGMRTLLDAPARARSADLRAESCRVTPKTARPGGARERHRPVVVHPGRPR